MSPPSVLPPHDGWEDWVRGQYACIAQAWRGNDFVPFAASETRFVVGVENPARRQ